MAKLARGYLFVIPLRLSVDRKQTNKKGRPGSDGLAKCFFAIRKINVILLEIQIYNNADPIAALTTIAKFIIHDS